jgi:hypothetical protein
LVLLLLLLLLPLKLKTLLHGVEQIGVEEGQRRGLQGRGSCSRLGVVSVGLLVAKRERDVCEDRALQVVEYIWYKTY